MATSSSSDKNASKSPNGDSRLVDIITRRTRDIYSQKPGTSRETLRDNSRSLSDSDSNNSNTDQSPEPALRGRTFDTPRTVEALWDKLSKMESDNRKNINSQSEIIANIAANMLRIQDSLKPSKNTINNVSTTSGSSDNAKQTDKRPEMNNNIVPDTDVGDDNTSADHDHSEMYEDISDDDDMELDIDDVMDTSVQEEIDNSSFYEEFEKLYEEQKRHGDNIDEQLAKLADQAINRPLKDEQLKELIEQFLPPENCTRIQAPLINKELWKGFHQKREADSAIQEVHKCMTTTLVMVMRALDNMKSKGDPAVLSGLIKNMFKMLTHGIYTANKKRKQLIRPGVPFKCKKVVEPNTPVTEYLFGDNLDTRLEEIEKEDKRASKLSFGGGFLGYKRGGKKMSGTPTPPKKYPKFDKTKSESYKKKNKDFKKFKNQEKQ